MKLITQTILLITSHLVFAKKFEECEFAEELYRRHEVPREDIYKHFCIASSLHTSRDSDPYAGIYRIGSKWWCGKDAPGGGCNVKCSDLLDDDIADDVTCANLILSQQGLGGWGTSAEICKRMYGQRADDCLVSIDVLNGLTVNVSETSSTVPTIAPTTTSATTIRLTTTDQSIVSTTTVTPTTTTLSNQIQNSTNDNDDTDFHNSPQQMLNEPIQCSCAIQNVLLWIMMVALLVGIAFVMFKYRNLKHFASSVHNKEYEDHLIN